MSANKPIEELHQRIALKTGRYLRPLTDLGNAERFLDKFGHDVLHIPESGSWVTWNGKRWDDADSDRIIADMSSEVVREIYVEAGECTDASERKNVATHANRSESARAISAMLTLAKPYVQRSVTKFDENKDLLNVQNGTLDLVTYELREPRRSDFMIQTMGTDYIPDAKAPVWDKFLSDMVPEDREFLQRYVGYALTGETHEQKMAIFQGKGRNGKGVLVHTLEKLFGSYYQTAPTDLFMAADRGKGAATPETARLPGKRLVVATETEDGKRLAEGKIKSLTGGDTEVARFLYGAPFEFTPIAKFMLVTNHRPIVRGVDAIWSRLMLVEFLVTISDEQRERDKGKLESVRLPAELPGILAWAIEGLKAWRETGSLAQSQKMREAVKRYRNEQDLMSQFINDCCVLQTTAIAPASALYGAYKWWCDNNGERPQAQRRFGQRITEDFEVQRGTSPDKKKARAYFGIGLQTGVPVSLLGQNIRTYEPERYSSEPATVTDIRDHRTGTEQGVQEQIGEVVAAATGTDNATAHPDVPQPQSTPGMSSLCKMSLPSKHADCQRAILKGAPLVQGCTCDCHSEGGTESGPPNGPELDNEPAEPTAFEQAMKDVKEQHGSVVDSTELPDVKAGRVSRRRPVSFTYRPTVYVDPQAGYGVTDDGANVTIAPDCTLSELLSMLPETAGTVYLTSAPGASADNDDFKRWALGDLPDSWKIADGGHRFDAEFRNRDQLRYERPNGNTVRVCSADVWTEGRAVTPNVLRDAFKLLRESIPVAFPKDENEPPLDITPQMAGTKMILRNLPFGKEYEVLDKDIQTRIRAIGGQGRNELFTETEPERFGDSLPGLYSKDLRWAYAATSGLGLPVGIKSIDNGTEFLGYHPAIYRVNVTVPANSETIGLLRSTEYVDGMQFPSKPGAVFEAWAQAAELRMADKHGWKIGEAITIVERIVFDREAKPLETWTRNMVKLREEILPDATSNGYDREVVSLTRVMVRMMHVQAIGALQARPRKESRILEAHEVAKTTPDAAPVSGGRFLDVEQTENQSSLPHPEWSAAIWARSRVNVLDRFSPQQRGAGALYVPRNELVAIRTDAVWTTVEPSGAPWKDNGKVGSYRTKIGAAGPHKTPRDVSELLDLAMTLDAESGE